MSTETTFTRVLRGYDPEEVEALIQKLRRELLTSKQLHDELQAQIVSLQSQVHDIQELESQKSAPTAEGMNAQVLKQIKKADKMATAIVTRAEADGLLIRSAADKNSRTIIDAAQEGYDKAVEAARDDAKRIIAEAEANAQEILAQAADKAEAMIADAREESTLLRGEAATYIANHKAEAHNQMHREKAEAQRKLDDMRLILATQAGPEKISQQLLDLLLANAEASAEQTKLATELENRHREAVLQTDTYVAAAQVQLATAKTRLREIEASVETLLQDAEKQAAEIRLAAEKDSQSMVRKAEKLSRQKVADSEKYVAAVLKSIYEQIETLQLEREKISAFFNALQLELEKTFTATTTAA